MTCTWRVTILLLTVLLLARTSLGKGGLCEVENGDSNIIMDIDESRANEISQPTTPEQLPIIGDPFKEVALDLIFSSRKPVFVLNGKKLQLLEPLDRDVDSLSHIVFQLTCTVKSTNKKRTIPVIVRVADINDNAPHFINTPYETSVSELTPIGTTVFQNIQARDVDAGVNGLVEYLVVPGDGQGLGTNSGIGHKRVTVADGFGYFSINLPHQGQVTVNRTLDYERTQRFLVTVVATDRARNSSQRFSTSTTLTVNIRDDDDQDPSFIYQGCMLLHGACINPEYTSSVSSGVLAGVLNISPEKIQAIDMDSINARIEYSFLSGAPSSYSEHFHISHLTGVVRQTKPVDTSVTKHFDIIVKAEEISEARRFTTAKLSITVQPVDVNPPDIQATAVEGHVLENAPVGTKVLDEEQRQMHFAVSDPDLGPNDPKPKYTFELTTDLFGIDSNGLLVVMQENLDRDPPSPGKFRFQVVAREVAAPGGNVGAASAPLTVTVYLIDVNDNPPSLPMVPPVSVEAGDGKRTVVQITAKDNDLGENAVVTYSIYHISNNGRRKFKIDPHTGTVTTSGKLIAGEQYSITVQATDTGGKTSQTIVEVTIVPGPNTRSPVFSQPVYDLQVSEGASINATVASVVAQDPEKDPVTYAILTGNDLRQFSIGYTSGVITVIRKLDREDLTRYQLLVKAEDSGGLSSTATVNIKVTDINDKNPEFLDTPYRFRVKEGLVNKTVGLVHAVDSDEGVNALVSYSAPDDVPFVVDRMTGEIMTTVALDYEKQKEHKFVVTATDGAADPRLATATVTIEVLDVEDELPIFHILEYRSTVPENVPDYMIIQVKADDADTVKKITYTMQQGPTDVFTVDPATGVVKCIRGLDYERESQYTIVVGTLENQSGMPGSTTKVFVQVEDRNDIPPVFTTVSRPITLEDEIAIGTPVTTLTASDSDGTAPGNKVRYELIGRRKAAKYFLVDPDTGVLSVRDDLRKETDTEYQVDIKAYDLGEPSLSSVTTVPIYVQHTATVPPEVGLGFADDYYTVDLRENATATQLVKTLVVVNGGHAQHGLVPLKCDIISGNNDGLFYTNVTAERNCEVRLRKAKLDRETVEEYQLGVKLDTLSGLVNPSKSLTNVKIAVVDVNDNPPQFTFPTGAEVYYGAIDRDAIFGTNVLTVKAVDKDSGRFALVSYSIVSDDGAAEYFTVDNTTGVIQTKKMLDSLTEESLPLVFEVEARDNYLSNVDSNRQTARVVVNLIEDKHRMVLVVEDSRQDELQGSRQRIMEILQEHSGLVVGIEKFAPKQFLTENRTLEVDTSATDIWFYAVDPTSHTILDRNHTKVQKSILDKFGMSNITFDVSGNLQTTASVIHGPLVEVRHRTAIAAVTWDVFPYTIIIIACLILVLGLVGIIYICISWSRYKAYKDRASRMYVAPRYDPVFVEPNNLKEYETQVLQMSVPIDDNESYNDIQLDFSAKNHAFSMENVSYVSKSNNSAGGTSPAGSDAATTARASSIAGHHQNNNLLNNHDVDHYNTNSYYQHRSSEDASGHNLNISSSNDNVMFREKKDYSHLGYNDRSPVETTTEL